MRHFIRLLILSIIQRTSCMSLQDKLANQAKPKWQATVSIRVQPDFAKRSSHHCAGTILQWDAVLTAASCFDVDFEDNNEPLKLNGYTIRIGAAPNSYELPVAAVFVHPNYTKDGLEFHHNIAILKLNKPIKTDSETAFGVIKVQLPNQTQGGDNSWPLHGTPCRVAGWGVSLTEAGAEGVKNAQLRKATVNIVNLEICNNDENYEGFLPSSVICAGRQEHGHLKWSTAVNPCNEGDVGGPLFCRREAFEKTEVQYGIVSFSKQCDMWGPTYPAVYTDIREYRSWIRGVLNSDQFKAAACDVTQKCSSRFIKWIRGLK